MSTGVDATVVMPILNAVVVIVFKGIFVLNAPDNDPFPADTTPAYTISGIAVEKFTV